MGQAHSHVLGQWNGQPVSRPRVSSHFIGVISTAQISADVLLFSESLVAEHEPGPSPEVAIENSLEPWGRSSKGCRSAAEAEA